MQADKLMQNGKIEVLAYHAFSVPFLGLSRDVVFKAMGCDCMQEGKSISRAPAVMSENSCAHAQYVPFRWIYPNNSEKFKPK